MTRPRLDGLRGGLLAAALTALLGVIDYRTGLELSVSVFYLVPVGLATWTGGVYPGVALSFSAACLWLWVNYPSFSGANDAIPIWNAAVRFLFFLVGVLALRLHRLHRLQAAATRQAREGSRLKSAVVSMAAREFSAAVAGLREDLGELRAAEPESEEAFRRRRYDGIDSAVHRLKGANENLANLHFLESDAFDLTLRRPGVEPLAQDAVLLLAPLLSGKKLRVRLDAADREYAIDGERSGLEAFLTGLLERLASSAPEGGALTLRVLDRGLDLPVTVSVLGLKALRPPALPGPGPRELALRVQFSRASGSRLGGPPAADVAAETRPRAPRAGRPTR